MGKGRKLHTGSRRGARDIVATLALAACATVAAGARAATAEPLSPLTVVAGMTGADLESLPSMLLAAAAAFVIFGLALALVYRRAGRATDEVQRLDALMNVLDEGIAVCNGMHVVSANLSLRRLIEIDDRPLDDLMLSAFVPDADTIDQLLSGGNVHIEAEVRSLSGKIIDADITARSIQHAGAQHRVLEIRDVGERRATQERVSFLAHHDSLTGLPNREVLRASLTEAVARAEAAAERCAVIWIDLDGFKELNDVHGHATGDKVLRAVAEKLTYELPAGTLVARLGGDEFVVLCEAISDPREGRLIGQQLRRLLNRPMEIGAISVVAGASIGVAVYPDDALNADDLLKNADLALYHAKSGGRGRCRHFTEALGRERQRHAALSEQLPRAIGNGEILAYFQPLVRTRDVRVIGFEALGRWFHPDFGSIPPFEFVRIAEETGKIGALTDVIVRQAIAAAQHWPEDVRVSVNVSPVQINAELVDQVRDLIKSSGFDPHRLELEVTEDVLIKDFAQTASMFSRLRALGVQIAMDDFGAGFTSLGNLRQLNFDRIKIDRIFTADLPKHRRSAAIVRSILVLARELNLDVTVEGVETAEQFNFLCNEGCREIQGFLFSPPKPASNWTDPAALQFPPVAAAAETALASSAALLDFGARAARRAS